MTTRDIIVYKRKQFFRDDYRTKKILKRGTKYNKGISFCAICGKQLTTFAPSNNGYYVDTPMIYFNYPSFFHLSICRDIRSCEEHLKQKEDMSDGTGRH